MDCNKYRLTIEEAAEKALKVEDLEKEFSNLYKHLSTCDKCLRVFLDLSEYRDHLKEGGADKELEGLSKSIFNKKVRPYLNEKSANLVEDIKKYIKTNFPSYLSYFDKLIETENIENLRIESYSFARGAKGKTEIDLDKKNILIIISVFKFFKDKLKDKKINPEKIYREVYKFCKEIGSSTELSLKLANYFSKLC